jgi:hypothetical protein
VQDEVSSVAGLKPDYRTRTATVGGTGRVGTVMGGFRSVVAGASLFREGQHGDENCKEVENGGGELGDKTRQLAKSVNVREVRLKRKRTRAGQSKEDRNEDLTPPLTEDHL